MKKTMIESLRKIIKTIKKNSDRSLRELTGPIDFSDLGVFTKIVLLGVFTLYMVIGGVIVISFILLMGGR